MAQSSVGAVLQELRGDIDASFAEHRLLLESASNAFHRRSRMRLQRSETRIASSTTRGFGRGDRHDNEENQQHHLHYGGGVASSGVQWDAFDVLLASIDTPQPSRSPVIRAHNTQHQYFQHSHLHERSLLRMHLVMLTSECKGMVQAKREAAPLSPEERCELMQLCFNGWRERARGNAKRRIAIADARHQFQRALLCRIFMLWWSWCMKQSHLRVYSEQVARCANAITLRSTYSSWKRSYQECVAIQKLRSTYQRAQTRSALTTWKQNVRRQHQMRLWRRERHLKLCSQAMKAWRSATFTQEMKSVKEKSARSFWQRRTQAKVFARLRRKVHIRAEIAQLQLRRAQNLQRTCLLEWCECLEMKKRSRFAAAWSKQKRCARAFDHWNGVFLRRKRNTRVLQSFWRRKQRNVAKHAFTAWTSLAQAERNQRLALLDALATKKNAAIIAKREATRILRDVGWKQWRTLYILMMRKQEFEARWKYHYTLKVWRGFTSAVGHKQRSNALQFKAVAHFKQHLRNRVFQSWVEYCSLIRARSDQVIKAKQFFKVKALKRALSALKDYQSDALSIQVADSFFIRWVVKMWRRNAELRKKRRAVRIERLSTLVQHIVLRKFFDRLKRFVQLRRREICLSVLGAWKELPRTNQARSLLVHLGCNLRLWRVWSRWVDHVRYTKQLCASTELVEKQRELSLKRFYLVDLWRDKATCYHLAFRKLENVGDSMILKYSFKVWLQLKNCRDFKRRADKAYVRSMKRKVFHQLMRMVADLKSRIREWKRRKLSVFWKAWRRFLQRKMILYDAERHHKTFRMHRAVSMLLACAHHGAKSHQLNEIAASWCVAVLMQRMFVAWQIFSAKQVDLRQRARSVEWRIVGRKAWCHWRKSLIQEQHVRVLQNMLGRNLLTQTWNALVQITKRRQVAKSMWRYTMVSVRLSKCLHSWQQYLKMCKVQRQHVDMLVQKKNKTHLRQFFAAWSQFLVIRAFSVIRKRREQKRYARKCWRIWTLHCQIHRIRLKSDAKLIRKVLILGLQRNAFYRQAARQVRFRNETRLLQQMLKQWRVEMWLRVSQRGIELEQKESVLRRWLRYVAQRQQKRRLAEYAKQLHRLHESSRAVRSNRRRRVFQEACVLQKQVDRQRRQVKREVFDAWHLAAKSAQRTRFKLLGSALSLVEQHDSLEDQENVPPNHAERMRIQGYRQRSKGSLGKDQSPQLASKKGNQVALEFWSSRLVNTCFYMWKHSYRSKKVGDR